MEPQIRQTVASAAQNIPAAAAWPLLCELGVVAFALPAWAGGFDLGQAAAVAVASELGRRGECTPYLGTVFAADCIAGLGPGGGRQELLAELASGQRIVSAVVPQASRGHGSRLVRAGTGLVARGCAGPACRGDSLTELFFVSQPATGPGPVFALGAARSARRSGLGTVVLDDTPAEPLTGPPIAAVLAGAIARARLRQAAYLAGLAAGAVDLARRHAVARRQFGSVLADFQSVRFRLAALIARVTAAELLVADTARRQDDAEPAHAAAAQALAMAAELALRATRDAVHLHGASGLAASAPVAACYQTAACEAPRLGVPADLWREATDDQEVK